jgi:CBS domain-containing protein
LKPPGNLVEDLAGTIEACIANERRATTGSPDPRAFRLESPNISCAGISDFEPAYQRAILFQRAEEYPIMTADFTVDAYMARHLITVHPETNVSEAIAILLKHQISGMPVVDDAGKLVGVLSEKDCLKTLVSAQYYEEPTTCVRSLMSTELETVTPKTDILTVAELFLHRDYRRFPVLDEGRLVGQISRRDVLKAIQEAGSAR